MTDAAYMFESDPAADLPPSQIAQIASDSRFTLRNATRTADALSAADLALAFDVIRERTGCPVIDRDEADRIDAAGRNEAAMRRWVAWQAVSYRRAYAEPLVVSVIR